MKGKKIQLFIVLFILVISKTVMAAQFTIAVRAHTGSQATFEKWRMTIELLNQRIPENNYKLITIVGLDEISERVRKREFDFLLTNPSSFVEVNKLYGVEAIATLNNKRADTAQNRFGSVIFTHVHNSGIKKISDLKNKTIMIVTEPAFGGWRVAWLEMLENNFDPYKELKNIIITKNGTQQEVVQAVRNRVVDAGVVRTDLLEGMESEGEVDMRYLRIINNKNIPTFPFFLSSHLYPEWAFSVLSHVPVSEAKKVQEVLFSVDQNSQAAIEGKYIGWIRPLDYSSVDELMRKLKVGPYIEKTNKRLANKNNGLKK